MRIQKFNKVGKFQDGGAIPAGDPSMQGEAQMGTEMQRAAGDEQAMVQQLAQVAQQIISQMGPDAAAMLAQIIMEMLDGVILNVQLNLIFMEVLQGGQAPVGGPQEGEPIFKKGGKLCGRMKKKAKMNKGGKC